MLKILMSIECAHEPNCWCIFALGSQVVWEGQAMSNQKATKTKASFNYRNSRMWHHMLFSHHWSQQWWLYESFLHGMVLWPYQYSQRAAFEIGSLKLWDLKSSYSQALFFFHLLIFKWSGFSASLQDFLVTLLREQQGTRTSLAFCGLKRCGIGTLSFDPARHWSTCQSQMYEYSYWRQLKYLELMS